MAAAHWQRHRLAERRLQASDDVGQDPKRGAGDEEPVHRCEDASASPASKIAAVGTRTMQLAALLEAALGHDVSPVPVPLSAPQHVDLVGSGTGVEQRDRARRSRARVQALGGRRSPGWCRPFRAGPPECVRPRCPAADRHRASEASILNSGTMSAAAAVSAPRANAATRGAGGGIRDATRVDGHAVERQKVAQRAPPLDGRRSLLSARVSEPELSPYAAIPRDAGPSSVLTGHQAPSPFVETAGATTALMSVPPGLKWLAGSW